MKIIKQNAIAVILIRLLGMIQEDRLLFVALLFMGGLLLIWVAYSDKPAYLMGLIFGKKYRSKYWKNNDKKWLWGMDLFIQDDLQVIVTEHLWIYDLTVAGPAMSSGPGVDIVVTVEEEISYLSTIDMAPYMVYIGDRMCTNIRIINHNTFSARPLDARAYLTLFRGKKIKLIHTRPELLN